MSDMGITVKKTEDFSEWYTQVILKSELADYAPVKGCMIFREHSYAIWEKIQEIFNEKIKATGHRNVYFPMFIPESFLKKEAEHFQGFVPEVAWVTIGGDRPLDEKLAIRPTSETIMYATYAKWIQKLERPPNKTKPMEQCRKMGNRSNQTLPANKRIPLARRTHSPRNKGRSRPRSNGNPKRIQGCD